VNFSAISPLDGRNKNKVKELAPYFSEFALDKYRILVELRYLKKLSEYKVIRKLTKKELAAINQLIEVFDEKDYLRIREIEKKTNHDLKAVEEYIKERLRNYSSSEAKRNRETSSRQARTVTHFKNIVEMVHFGLTSDDTNNIAYALMIKESLHNVLIPELKKIEAILKSHSQKYQSIPMLGRTHGQPAVPTTVGKEFLVYYKRLKKQIKALVLSKVEGKITGNVGNLNVHKFLFPKINWLKFSREFVESFGLKADLVTTQIEPYDSLIRIFHQLSTINYQLLGLSLDSWMYLSFGYFKQKVIKTEVGSTALPHKVNPIYFEGAEGGFGIANALLEFYCRKLSHSRLQRDLSDSTVRRSFGIAFGYCLLSYQSIVEALSRIEPNAEKINDDLDSHWEILSEAIQNFLRTKGYKDAYKKTKLFFRGRKITKDDVAKFINGLRLEKKDKEMLLELTPEKYTGYAEELVEKYTSSVVEK
jgi:adenylosuccinate lyase